MEDDDLQVNMTLNTDDYMDNIRRVIDQTNKFKDTLNEVIKTIGESQKIKLDIKINLDSKEAVQKTSEIRNGLVKFGGNKIVKIEAVDLVTSKLLTAGRVSNNLFKNPKKLLLEAVDKTKDKIKNISDGISKLKELAKKINLGEKAKEAYDWTIGSAMNNEEYLLSLKNAMGNKAAAQNALSFSYSEAEKTPFDVGDIVNAVSSLAENKIDYEKFFQPLGNIAAAKNKSLGDTVKFAEDLKSGDMASALKSGKDFGITNEMWQKAGMKFDKTGNLQGSPDSALKALNSIVKNNKWDNAMKDKSNTGKGMMDNIKKTFKGMGMNIAGVDTKGNIQAGGMFSELKKQLQTIQPILQKFEKSKAFSNLKKDINSLVSTAGKNITKWLLDLQKHPGKIDAAFKKVEKSVKAFFNILKLALSIVSKNPKTSFKAFAALKIAPAVIDGFLKLNGIIGELDKRSQVFNKLNTTVKGFVSAAAKAIGGTLVKIISAASTVIQSAVKGVFALFEANPIILAITAIIAACVLLYEAWKHNWGGIRDKTKAVVDEIQKIWKNLTDFLSHPIKATVNFVEGLFGGKTDGKHATGLSYVPYNGYIAELHEGERVLTAQQNRSMANGFGGLSIAKLADTIVVREEADIDKIANALARKINAAALNM